MRVFLFSGFGSQLGLKRRPRRALRPDACSALHYFYMNSFKDLLTLRPLLSKLLTPLMEDSRSYKNKLRPDRQRNRQFAC